MAVLCATVLSAGVSKGAVPDIRFRGEKVAYTLLKDLASCDGCAAPRWVNVAPLLKNTADALVADLANLRGTVL